MRIFAAVVILLVMIMVPAPLPAKGKTTRIRITGPGLATAIEITDPKVLANFSVWTGPGTRTNEAEGFLIVWSQGAAAEPPKEIPRYQCRSTRAGGTARLRGVLLLRSFRGTRLRLPAGPGGEVVPAQRRHDFPPGGRELVSHAERVGQGRPAADSSRGSCFTRSN